MTDVTSSYNETELALLAEDAGHFGGGVTLEEYQRFMSVNNAIYGIYRREIGTVPTEHADDVFWVAEQIGYPDRFAPAEPEPERQLIGFHADGHFDGFGWRRAKQIEMCQFVGGKVMRTSVLRSIDRTDPTRKIETVVAEMLTAGIVPVLSVRGFGQLRQNGTLVNVADDIIPTPAQEAEAFASFAAWCADLVRRLPGVVHWEIWNEPNEPYFWKGGQTVSPTRYARLFKLCRDAMRAVRPAVQVGLGGITGLAASIEATSGGTGYGKPGIDFIRDTVRILGRNGYDAAGIHPYDSSRFDQYVQWEGNFTDIDLVHALLEAEGHHDVPLWATEWGVPVGMALKGGGGTVTEQVQAECYTTAVRMLRERPFVTIATAFVDYDRTEYAGWGVFRTPTSASQALQPKPAALAFRAAANG